MDCVKGTAPRGPRHAAHTEPIKKGDLKRFALSGSASTWRVDGNRTRDPGVTAGFYQLNYHSHYHAPTPRRHRNAALANSRRHYNQFDRPLVGGFPACIGSQAGRKAGATTVGRGTRRMYI